MPRIYVASSWRNKYQPEVVAALRKAGHEVYDFRNPKDKPGGFHWADVDENWQEWSSKGRVSAPEDGTKASERSFSGANWL